MKTIIARIKNPWVVTAGLCVAVYIYVIAGSIYKPFATDEIYNAGWAYGITQTGAPAYYSGEDVELMPRLKEPVSHPPLHVNLLALMILIFGMKYWALRLLGVFVLVAMLWFLRYRVYQKLDSPNERLVLTGVFLVFNPLILQQSIVLAIEAQVFWFPMLVFFYYFYKESVQPARHRFYPYLWSTAGMFVLLWLKETNFPLYFAASLLFLVMIRQFRKIPGFLLATLVAVTLFWLSWELYCLITGADVWSWWNFTVKKKLLSGSDGAHAVITRYKFADAVNRIFRSLRVTLDWASVPYVVLFFSAIVIRIRDIVAKRRPIAFMELLALYTLMLLGATKIMRPTESFIKYEMPAHVLAAIFMADVYFGRAKKEIGAVLFILCAGLIAALGIWYDIPDRILYIDDAFAIHVIYSTLIVGIVGACFFVLQRKSFDVSLYLGCLAAMVMLNGTLFIHQSVNDYTTGQSWGNYGEDLVPVTRWLKRNLKNGETFASFKDLQFNMRFVEGKTLSPTYEARTFTTRKKSRKWSSDEAEMARILQSGEIKYFVLNRYSNNRAGREYLAKFNYRKIARLKSHVIYEKREDAPRHSARDGSQGRHANR